MDKMSLVLLGAASAFVAPAQAAEVASWQAPIAEAAQRFSLPESWIRAVIAAESGGDPRAVSPKGAMGLMQLMPQTWTTLRLRYCLGADPFQPRDNILAGAAYLGEMRDRFGYPGLFAAYSAGPARYEQHLRTARPLPAETRSYIAALARMPADVSMPPAMPSATRLFVALRTVAGDAEGGEGTVPAGGLFVPLTTVPGQKK